MLMAMQQGDSALEDVRYYLAQWRRWVKAWRAPLGYPTASPIVRVPAKPPVGCGNVDDALEEPYRYQQEIDDFVLRAVDAEVESLPNLKRAAVRLIYLREVLPAVFRSGRMSMEETVRLCNEAEFEMIPGLRRRGVVLGGY